MDTEDQSPEVDSTTSSVDTTCDIAGADGREAESFHEHGK